MMKMEPEQEPGFDLNYPVPLLKELPGFSGSGSEPDSITSFGLLLIQLLMLFTFSLKDHLIPR